MEKRNPNCLFCKCNPKEGNCPHYDSLNWTVEGCCHWFKYVEVSNEAK